MYRIIILLIAIYLVFAAYLQIPELMQYDNKRILQLLLLTIISCILFVKQIQNIRKKNYYTNFLKHVFSKYIIVAITILFFSGLISVFQAAEFRAALLDFSFFFLLLALMVGISPVYLKSQYFLGRTIFGTALIFTVVYTVIFFGNYISSFLHPMITLWPGKYDFVLTINEVSMTGKETLYFDHKRFFNHTQTWSLPVLIGLLTYYQGSNKHKSILISLMILTSFWWMLLFASGGRGSIVGITVALFIILVISKKDAYKLFKNKISTIFLGGIFYWVFFKLLTPDSVAIPLLRSSDSGRFSMWEKAIDMWLQNPIFGAGPMHFARISVEPYFAHPHNFYIQFLSEWGIIAFVAFIILGIAFFKLVYKNYFQIERNFSNRIIYLTFTWALIAASIHAFFSGVMHTPMSQMWLVLLISWFFGFTRYDSAIHDRKKIINYMSIMYFILLPLIIWLILDDVNSLVERYENYTNSFPDSKMYPRFWGQGLFR